MPSSHTNIEPGAVVVPLKPWDPAALNAFPEGAFEPLPLAAFGEGDDCLPPPGALAAIGGFFAGPTLGVGSVGPFAGAASILPMPVSAASSVTDIDSDADCAISAEEFGFLFDTLLKPAPAAALCGAGDRHLLLRFLAEEPSTSPSAKRQRVLGPAPEKKTAPTNGRQRSRGRRAGVLRGARHPMNPEAPARID